MGRNSRVPKISLDGVEDVDEDAEAAKAFDQSQRKSSKRARPDKEIVHVEDESKDVSHSHEEHPGHAQAESIPKERKRPRLAPPKNSVEFPGPSETEPSTEDAPQKYERYILFVGQIPFDATGEEVARHFADHGAGKVRVRLLSDKKTGKSRGMAFVDFENAQQLVRGLRVHHTRLRGRAINVERTVGGGGNNDARKEKLKDLREFQGSRVRREVQAIVDETIAASKGSLTAKDADELVIQSLCALPRDAAKQVMEEVLESDIGRARNKKAWILGCIKRYTARLKTGEQFLKLGEEKAGIVEKQRRTSAPKSANATPSVVKRGAPFKPVGEGNMSKFKRGRIGA